MDLDRDSFDREDIIRDWIDVCLNTGDRNLIFKAGLLHELSRIADALEGQVDPYEQNPD